MGSLLNMCALCLSAVLLGVAVVAAVCLAQVKGDVCGEWAAKAFCLKVTDNDYLNILCFFCICITSSFLSFLSLQLLVYAI